MSKPAAVRIDRLVDIPLDRDGLFLRAERRHWQDGTSCLHVAKWGTDEGGRKRPWWPLQYMQVPWELAPGVLDGLLAAAGVEIPYLVRAELGLLADLVRRASSALWLREARGGSLRSYVEQEDRAMQDLAEWRECLTPEIVGHVLADVQELERMVDRLAYALEMRDAVSRRDGRKSADGWRAWAEDDANRMTESPGRERVERERKPGGSSRATGRSEQLEMVL